MPRLMSVAMTVDAVIERRKTVTRRKGWWLDKNGRRILKPGDRLILHSGDQGDTLAEVEVVDVSREPLMRLLRNKRWAFGELRKEGVPRMTPADFAHRYFVEAQGMSLDDKVTRIEWRYIDE
jgi:hypothetical protein